MNHSPLAEQMRPLQLKDFLGQGEVLAKIDNFIQKGFLPNLIFWGPPGTGKTTLARLLRTEFDMEFHALNAAESGAKIIKDLGDQARRLRIEQSRQTILFIDEIHRFNKSQQDYLLSYIERGDLILIGATTENPAYELNRALLSRCRILRFHELSVQDLRDLALRVLTPLVPSGADSMIHHLDSEALEKLVEWSQGDGRRLLLALEEVIQSDLPKPLGIESLRGLLGTVFPVYDKASDQHYDHLSAFIKSLRGSDPDAALYYLGRMLLAGEDPRLLARRMVIFASEDVGNADPRALMVAVAGAQALELVGLPEAEINLSHVVNYLATAPKSNRSYLAWKKAKAWAERPGVRRIPPYLKSSGFSAAAEKAGEASARPLVPGGGSAPSYAYPHDFPKGWVHQRYLPLEIQGALFYEPSNHGYERHIREFLKWLKSEGGGESGPT